MPAHEHIAPYQLAMLMPARELEGMHSLDNAGYGGDADRMRNAKRRVNEISSLGKSLATEGFRKPVQIAHGRDPAWVQEMGKHHVAVANGNHRVTAAFDANPDMEVPVEHYDKGTELLDAMFVQDRGEY